MMDGPSPTAWMFDLGIPEETESGMVGSVVRGGLCMKKKAAKTDEWPTDRRAAGYVLDEAISRRCINAILGAIKDGANMTDSRWSCFYYQMTAMRHVPESVVMERIESVIVAARKLPSYDETCGSWEMIINDDRDMKVYASIRWRGLVERWEVNHIVKRVSEPGCLVSPSFVAYLLNKVRARGGIADDALPIAEQFIDQYLKKEDTI